MILERIARGDKGANVKLLHQVLAILGLEVQKDEVSRGFAGDDTLTKVRNLQDRLGVTADVSVLLDEATAIAIVAHMTTSGLVAASRTFNVSGQVTFDNGSSKKRQKLVAYDLDLGGVSVFRTLEKISAIPGDVGFDYLGEAVTDNRGHYAFTFYDWQYRRAEFKLADVVVFAVDDDDNIIGRSRMVNTQDYSLQGTVRDLNIILIKEEKRTEFDVLMSGLKKLLKDSGMSLSDIAKSEDLLAFCASELDIDRTHLNLVVSAKVLAGPRSGLPHELLYGIGRQNIKLDHTSLFRKQEEDIRAAIKRSIKQKFIKNFTDDKINVFFHNIQSFSIKHILDTDDRNDPNSVNARLSNALPKDEQRTDFLKAIGTFTGSEFSEFWKEHLPKHAEFKDNPELISDLFLMKQLTDLTGNHQKLVTGLQAFIKKPQAGRETESLHQLLDLEKEQWDKILEESGVPESIPGENDEDKRSTYADHLQNTLNAAFPTQRILRILRNNQLGIENPVISGAIEKFLANKEVKFDFSKSVIDDFKEEIKAVANDDEAAVTIELKKIQRGYQVATSPHALTVLLDSGLHSAYKISNMPRKSFIRRYGKKLGGDDEAFGVHQRASHISARAENNLISLKEQTSEIAVPAGAGSGAAAAMLQNKLKKKLPNYAALFGSPDLCECRHCRSVYSAAAYFVELLQFLRNTDSAVEEPSLLEILKKRRPDLEHLLLSCENTNTLIPYIDLVNEVMEFYAAEKSLDGFPGHDTGDATAEELRANPQYVNKKAYKNLAGAKFSFSLPFHQPLHVIRTYSNHLKVSRYEAMKAINPTPEPIEEKAIAAEGLGFSEEEYKLLTGMDFNETLNTSEVHELYGYAVAEEIEQLSPVRAFMEKTGLAYVDVVEILKTRFINPHQNTLDIFEEFFNGATIDSEMLYDWLTKSANGDATSDVDNAAIDVALAAANGDEPIQFSHTELAAWALGHFAKLQQVITLFEPESECDLETTRLRTIQAIYEKEDSPASTNAEGDMVDEIIGISLITVDLWSKLHRFIRLWRKLGWTIHETDLLLAAIGHKTISTDTIAMLEPVLLLREETKRPLNQLAVLWGNIDTYGDKSLYKKLFLNKAAQLIDPDFEADADGKYLQENAHNLADHKSSVLAAFGLSEDEFETILAVAQVKDDDVTPRRIKLINDAPIEADSLSLPVLTTIYRYVVMAKAVKMSVIDLCKLIELFDAAPFSVAIVNPKPEGPEFIDVAPDATYDFYKLATSIKAAKFKAAELEYIFTGIAPADSNIALDADKIMQAIKSIRNAFNAIEQSHPTIPDLPLTAETLSVKLSLTFQPDLVSRFMDIINGAGLYETHTDAGLGIEIPENLASKFSYDEDSGRLTSDGVMSDIERNELVTLGLAVPGFENAVGELFEAPENFITESFEGIFIDDIPSALAVLLDRPAQPTSKSLEEKFLYVYEHLIPKLRSRLQRDTITDHIAGLIDLSNEAAALLLAEKTIDLDDVDTLDTLTADLSTEGFSATYFSDFSWTDIAKKDVVDKTINFSWGESGAPVTTFSVRWRSYISAPASGEFTLIVEVEEADETFNLYLDDTLILNKPANDIKTRWEVGVDLHSTQMHLLMLEYAEESGSAGVRLYWKTATFASEIVPASAAYPARNLEKFIDQISKLHRAAIFIDGFDIDDTELAHFIEFNSDFDNIDFKALTKDHWQRIHDYTIVRNSVPQNQALLTDVFALANRSPEPEMTALTEKLHQATAWDTSSLTGLVEHFSLKVADFKNENALMRLHGAMAIISKTGLSAATIAIWGDASKTAFDELNDTAQLMRDVVKAKYDEKQWLTLAANLSDNIREAQKQALISYLLVQDEIIQAEVEDADGLFEHFLIDVQMGPCLDTSRIVQANAAVQLFINRCLMNMEDGVSPAVIDADRWEWMKNYRVWEANRKVFLYPENWLNPEWRFDRSEFFKDLESHLTQNDINARSVEQGLRNYLMRLDEVSNLDVCGMHRENSVDGKLKYLHVFGRTHNLPYKYFYRRWDKYEKWSAWETVQADIRSVEDGKASGVHLVPVVWKGRLFLFWPEFMEMSAESSEIAHSENFEALGNLKPSAVAPKKYWEIRMAWSEYVDDTWTPKQVTKEFVSTEKMPDVTPKGIVTYPSLDYNTQELSINLKMPDAPLTLVTFSDSGVLENLVFQFTRPKPKFIFTDIQSSISTGIDLEFTQLVLRVFNEAYYDYAFSKRAKSSKLQFAGRDYLKTETNHQLLPVDTQSNLHISHEDPFFFNAGNRSYFVQPLETRTKIFNPSDFKRDLDPSTIVGTLGHESPSDTPESPFVSAISATDMRVVSSVRPSFGSGTVIESTNDNVSPVANKNLLFHTFYHPHTSNFVENLNRVGLSRGHKSAEDSLPGLFDSDTEITSNEEAAFLEFDPNFDFGLIAKPSDFDKRTYYKENICFDPFGANSLYNWELFFHAPLYIATRLSKNGQYKEAREWFHYIFDPTTTEAPEDGNETARYWKVPPFKTGPGQRLEDFFKNLDPKDDENYKEEKSISEWRDNPFDPHLVAGNRPVAYMKHVVIQYVENLLNWGDSLFRQFTRESVYEAIQLYVMASHILGPRPESVPKRGKIKSRTYKYLQPKLDDFSNALIEMENIFPFSSAVNVTETSTGTNMLNAGEALYFCIPTNDKLLHHWDTVADRLFKIRHCKDINGTERTLALFAPAIDPALLIQARAQGLSIGSVLANLNSPSPIYRFTFLLQKANEFCSDVKALGSALLSALEKKDAEELSRLRASQEVQMLELVTAIRERQVLSAKAGLESLGASRDTAKFRLQYYTDLLGQEPIDIPDVITIDANLTDDGPLPTTTQIAPVETGVDGAVASADEGGVKLISREKEELEKSQDAGTWQNRANWTEMAASAAYFMPEFGTWNAPFGLGVNVVFGGSAIGSSLTAAAKGANALASSRLNDAQRAGKLASYIRRGEDWAFQANSVSRSLVELDKQITSAQIQLQVAEKELENHKTSIENSGDVERFLKDKFSNQELYQWMKDEIFSVYKQSYNLAFDMAKQAEKACGFELGTEDKNFIQYGIWENAVQGLTSGEKLQLALRQLEKSYLDENRRELELRKSISLALLNPLALIELRETGKCHVSLPEEMFDLDFPGHYFRRIKSVSLSIPCVAGPYTTVNCTLRLMKNSVRINTSMNEETDYPENTEADDPRFRSSLTPVTSIATSSGQNDSGVFELNFNDPRYLPFEYAGAISEWSVELFSDNTDGAEDFGKALRQFDYDTIADAILHVTYTAREAGGTFKTKVFDHLRDQFRQDGDTPALRLFNLKHDFATSWHRFAHPKQPEDGNVLKLKMAQNLFPIIDQGKTLKVDTIRVLARCKDASGYEVHLSPALTATSDALAMTQTPDGPFGPLHVTDISPNTPIEINPANPPQTWNLKMTGPQGALRLDAETGDLEVEDVLLVLGYHWD